MAAAWVTAASTAVRSDTSHACASAVPPLSRIAVAIRDDRDEAARIVLLRREVRRALGDTGLGVTPWREGVDYFADLVRHHGDGRIVGVVRSPRHEVLSTGYEGTVDFADVLTKEVHVLRLLGRAGVPAPSVLAWRRRSSPRGISWVLCEHVDHQPATALNEDQQHELGRIASRLRAAVKYCPNCRSGPRCSGARAMFPATRGSRRRCCTSTCGRPTSAYEKG